MSAKQDSVDSVFELVPYISQTQSRFSTVYTLVWIQKNWTVAIPIIMLYLILVFSGRMIMAKREKFELRRYLVCWNVGLAAFSVIGFVSVAPNLILSLYRRGFEHTVCHTTAVINPNLSLWAFVFTLSKVVELGDTAFIVLRKAPLSFLHWYHHMTVLFYTWYIMGHRSVSTFAGGELLK